MPVGVGGVRALLHVLGVTHRRCVRVLHPRYKNFLLYLRTSRGRSLMLDEAALSHLLASASLSEHTPGLTAQLDALNALIGTPDQRHAIMDVLKRAGCTKMGIRRDWPLLLPELACSRTWATAAAAGRCRRPIDDRECWTALMQQSSQLTCEECHLQTLQR